MASEVKTLDISNFVQKLGEMMSKKGDIYPENMDLLIEGWLNQNVKWRTPPSPKRPVTDYTGEMDVAALKQFLDDSYGYK